MSRLERAVEILEAINKHFECDQELSPYAQILDGDVNIKDAIADCLGREEEPEKVIPRSKRYRISFHAIGGWSGWRGKRKLRTFLTEEEARKWLNLSEQLY